MPGDPLALPQVYSLPPTSHHGPVVLDMPYEELPSCTDDCLVPNAAFPDCFTDLWAPQPWFWQMLPNNLIYTSYLAGPKEPRIGSVMYQATNPDVFNPSRQEGTLWDTTLGGRASILRYGSDPVVHPQGFEVQIEGAAFVRLDPQDDRDLRYRPTTASVCRSSTGSAAGRRSWPTTTTALTSAMSRCSSIRGSRE